MDLREGIVEILGVAQDSEKSMDSRMRSIRQKLSEMKPLSSEIGVILTGQASSSVARALGVVRRAAQNQGIEVGEERAALIARSCENALAQLVPKVEQMERAKPPGRDRMRRGGRSRRASESERDIPEPDVSGRTEQADPE